MTSTLRKKIGVKQGMRMILVDAPTSAVEALGLSTEVLAPKLVGMFDYIHLFARLQEDLNTAFPKLKRHLRETGMLWISWPKGRGLGSDLTLQEIIRIGYDHGLVESKTISADATWSAIKFTFPKEGKQYNNSYGQLK